MTRGADDISGHLQPTDPGSTTGEGVSRSGSAQTVYFVPVHTAGGFREPLTLPASGGRLGRGGEVVLADSGVSRLHAEVRRDGSGWSVLDLGSRNGTFLGGRRLEPHLPVPLVDGDVLRLHDVVLVFRSGGAIGDEGGDDPDLPGRAPGLDALRRAIRSLAALDVPVLILGETGTGKEFVARALHAQGGRSREPFVDVNCGDLSRNLLRRELFGADEGAYTGARRAEGLVATAGSGTLFLDEIGELEPEAQVELLRFLQDGSFRRVGASRAQTSKARIIAATNVDLAAAVLAGRFRQDLLARLRMYATPLQLPPLRERREDIPVWVDRALKDLSARTGLARPEWTAGFIECLCLYDWPDNLRELWSVVSHAVRAAEPGPLRAEHLPEPVTAARRQGRTGALPEAPRTEAPPAPEPTSAASVTPRTAASVSREEIVEALTAHRGNMRRTAEALGIDRRSLYRLCDEFALSIDEFR